MDVGLGRYDQPPPVRIDDIESFVAEGRCRFANRLTAWAEVDGDRIVASGSSGGGLLAPTEVGPRAVSLAVRAIPFPELRSTETGPEDGSVTFVQTAGGRTGAPFPRQVGGSKRWRLTAPTAWTTISATIAPDGQTSLQARGASPFPRHFFYDADNDLMAKSATIDFDRWTKGEHDEDTPWGGSENEMIAAAAESEIERTLSVLMMQDGLKPRIRTFDTGDVLIEEGGPVGSISLVLDGVVEIEVGGRIVGECGPGSILGERAFLEQGVGTSTVRAVTTAKTAEADPSNFAPEHLERLRELHRRELEQHETDRR